MVGESGEYPSWFVPREHLYYSRHGIQGNIHFLLSSAVLELEGRSQGPLCNELCVRVS